MRHRERAFSFVDFDAQEVKIYIEEFNKNYYLTSDAIIHNETPAFTLDIWRRIVTTMEEMAGESQTTRFDPWSIEMKPDGTLVIKPTT